MKFPNLSAMGDRRLSAFEIELFTAKRYLLTGSDTVADIAQLCGFASQSYFNYRFKEQVGLSPLQYRKKMLSKIDL